MTPSPLVKRLTLLLLVGIWGTTWAVIRVGLRGIPPFTGVAMRFAIAGVLLWMLALVMGLRGRRLLAPPAVWLVNGLTTFAGSYGIVYWAEQVLPSGLTAVIFATFPLFVAAIAHFVLPSERLRGASLLGLPVGLLGVAVLFASDLLRVAHPADGQHVLRASLVMLLSPLVSSVGQVVVKRWGGGVHPVTLNAGSMVVCALVMGALAAIFERGRPLHLDRPSIAALLYLAVLGTCVTFTLYFWLLKNMPATHLALTAYAIPVVAVLVGAVVFAEPITWQLLAGGALVIAGTVITTRRRAAS